MKKFYIIFFSRFGLISGALTFFLSTIACSGLLYVKLGLRGKKYFINEYDCFTMQLMSGFMTFMVIWIISYDMVHIF